MLCSGTSVIHNFDKHSNDSSFEFKLLHNVNFKKIVENYANQLNDSVLIHTVRILSSIFIKKKSQKKKKQEENFSGLWIRTQALQVENASVEHSKPPLRHRSVIYVHTYKQSKLWELILETTIVTFYGQFE